MDANTFSSKALVDELSDLLSALDFARWRADLAADLRGRLERVRTAARELRTRAGQHPGALHPGRRSPGRLGVLLP
jgi:hypothetical protein